MFDEGHFTYVMVQGTQARQPLPPLATPGTPTDAEMISFAEHMSGFLAAAGTYEFDGTTVTYHPVVVQQDNEPAGYGDIVLNVEFDGEDQVAFVNSAGTRWIFTRAD